MLSNRLGFWCFLLVNSLWACSGIPPSAPPLSAPFFQPIPEDAPRLSRLTHDLDAKVLQCAETDSCEQVHFARALVSLFENQEAARASFRHVIEHNPGSPLATSSRGWLRLIEAHETGAGSSPITDIVALLVREWMERQLSERANFESAVSPGTMQEQPVEQPRVVQGLLKQVRERDRQIAVLQSQLEALRLIDQDHAKRTRQPKLPTLTHPQ